MLHRNIQKARLCKISLSPVQKEDIFMLKRGTRQILPLDDLTCFNHSSVPEAYLEPILTSTTELFCENR